MKLDAKLMKHIDLLIERYPVLKSIKDSIIDAYLLMEQSYLNGGKLLIAGNGGSASDSEHIAGELMKSFKLERRISDELKEKLIAIDSVRGEQLSKNLQQPLLAIPPKGSASSTFLASPRINRDNPSNNACAVSFLLLRFSSWGRNSLCSTMGPAISCGKKVIKQAYSTIP